MVFGDATRPVQGLRGSRTGLASWAVRSLAVVVFSTGCFSWAAKAEAAFYDCADPNVSVSGTLSANTEAATHVLTFGHVAKGTAIHFRYRSDAEGTFQLASRLSDATPGAAEGGIVVPFTEPLSETSNDFIATGSTSTAEIELTLSPEQNGASRAAVSYWATCYEPRRYTLAASADASEPGTAGAFTISASSSLNESAVITYAVSGSANNGTDYETLTGEVIMPAGETQVTIPVTPIDDELQEGTESVALSLSTAELGVISTAAASLKLGDDEGLEIIANPGPFTISEPLPLTSKSQGSRQIPVEVSVPVQLGAAPEDDVTLEIETSDASEVTVSPTHLTFSPTNWAKPQLVTVTGLPDGEVDGDQTTIVTLHEADTKLRRAITVVTADADASKSGGLGSNGEAEAFRSQSRTFILRRLTVVTEHMRLPGASNGVQLGQSGEAVDGSYNVSSDAGPTERRRKGSTRIWSDGAFSFSTQGSDSTYVSGRVGADVALADGAILGLLGTFDTMTMDTDANAKAHGHGAMGGAYLSAPLFGGLRLDVMGLAGTSSNSLSTSQFATPLTADFATSRLLAAAEISGSFETGAVELRPHANLSYAMEQQKNYTIADGTGDTLGINGVKVGLARASLGGDIYWHGEFETTTITPFAGGDVGWDFSNLSKTGGPTLAARVGVEAHTATTDISMKAEWHSSDGLAHQDISAQAAFTFRF
jgi:Calx-beta domain